MDLRQFDQMEFYNLIVAFDERAWKSNAYGVDKSRFLEFTGDDIKSKFSLLDNNSLQDIQSFPCLFLPELDTQELDGHIGYITKIRVRSKDIAIQYELVEDIPMDQIIDLTFELDIQMPRRGITELHRTHWAIKRVNLLEELRDAGLIPTFSKPKVFISYSWDSHKTRQIVELLTSKLESDGIEVVYDRKSLLLGNDMIRFMERLVNDQSIEKVLLFCDQSYKEKADARSSGVGIETKIIAPNIYGAPDQNKFIPVLLETDKNNNPFVPTYLNGLLGVNFTKGFDIGEYQKLLTDIFNS